ncbi:OmpH family outer membrane protein [bacterium]|nr:OmpH family outer membrane protein [bacterium]MCP5462792.1 OmpH family outer membrane protein [bacterium]
MKKTVVGTIISAALILGVAQGIFAQNIKVAVVDFDEVVKRYYKTQVYQEKMREEVIGEENILKEKIEEINQIRDEMELLSDEAKEEKEKMLQMKIAEAQGSRDQTKKEFQRKMVATMNEIFNEIYVEIEKQGKEGGYTFVLRKRVASPAIDQPIVLYADDQYEITEAIIEALNENQPVVEPDNTAKPQENAVE